MTRIKIRINDLELECEGSAAFLRKELPRFLELASASHNGQVKADLLTALDELQHDQAVLEASHERISRLNEELSQMIDHYHQETAGSLAAGGAEGGLAASQRMQAIEASFNQQSLALQQQAQEESQTLRRITTIMRHKHDTVRNSINNVR